MKRHLFFMKNLFFNIKSTFDEQKTSEMHLKEFSCGFTYEKYLKKQCNQCLSVYQKIIIFLFFNKASS